MKSMQTLSHYTARAAELSFRTDCWIGGRFVPAASGARFPSVNPATGAPLAEVARGGAEDVDRAVASARAAFEDGRWSRQTPGARKEVLLRLAALIHEHLEELALTRHARHGQADHRDGQRRRAGVGALLPVARRGDRQGLRRDRADRRPGSRDDPAGAARGGRRGGAVELPARHGDLEAGAGARGRQLGGAEAGRAVAALRAAARRARRRGGAAGRGAERGAGLRRGGRGGARAAHGRRLPGLHRLDGGRRRCSSAMPASRT